MEHLSAARVSASTDRHFLVQPAGQPCSGSNAAIKIRFSRNGRRSHGFSRMEPGLPRSRFGAGWSGRQIMAQKQSHEEKWSAEVAEHSDALDLEKGVFTKGSPQQIAQSLKHSAEQ